MSKKSQVEPKHTMKHGPVASVVFSISGQRPRKFKVVRSPIARGPVCDFGKLVPVGKSTKRWPKVDAEAALAAWFSVYATYVHWCDVRRARLDMVCDETGRLVSDASAGLPPEARPRDRFDAALIACANEFGPLNDETSILEMMQSVRDIRSWAVPQLARPASSEESAAVHSRIQEVLARPSKLEGDNRLRVTTDSMQSILAQLVDVSYWAGIKYGACAAPGCHEVFVARTAKKKYCSHACVERARTQRLKSES